MNTSCCQLHISWLDFAPHKRHSCFRDLNPWFHGWLKRGRPLELYDGYNYCIPSFQNQLKLTEEKDTGKFCREIILKPWNKNVEIRDGVGESECGPAAKTYLIKTRLIFLTQQATPSVQTKTLMKKKLFKVGFNALTFSSLLRKLTFCGLIYTLIQLRGFSWEKSSQSSFPIHFPEALLSFLYLFFSSFFLGWW